MLITALLIALRYQGAFVSFVVVVVVAVVVAVSVVVAVVDGGGVGGCRCCCYHKNRGQAKRQFFSLNFFVYPGFKKCLDRNLSDFLPPSDKEFEAHARNKIGTDFSCKIK